MTPREFFNAWQGWADAETNRMEVQRSVIWSSMQQHAVWTSWSSKQSRNISRQKPPWKEGGSKKKNEPLKWDKMQGFFNAISTEENGD